MPNCWRDFGNWLFACCRSNPIDPGSAPPGDGNSQSIPTASRSDEQQMLADHIAHKQNYRSIPTVPHPDAQLTLQMLRDHMAHENHVIH